MGLGAPFNDLRQYIAALDVAGEIQHVEKEVDWNLEVGAVTRRSCDLKAPAPLFHNIKGYPRGYRVLGAPICLSNRPGKSFVRLALAFGLPENATAADIMEAYLERKKSPIKPVLVATGPCKENIHVGDDVDLFEFPAPVIHDGDGGRYLGTWVVVITKDPDTGWVNWGVYRQMIQEKNVLGGLIFPMQHIGYHYFRKYEPRGLPMPFAIAIGADPLTVIAATAKVPAGVDEVDICGGLRGAPVELVKCETVDLDVPAGCEIVIEGHIPPGERREEGPFGEYTGYKAADRAPRPVYRVTAVTHRNDPILPIVSVGVPVEDNNLILSLTKGAELLDQLRNQGFPVKMVFCPPEGVGHLTAISTKVPFPNYARHLANAVWGTEVGRTCWYVAITDEDVDVTNLNEVVWAITTRCHPIRGVMQMPNAPGHALVPFISPDERKRGSSAQILFDCTWPKDWAKEEIPVKASLDCMWPEELRRNVVENWSDYGYEPSEGNG